jgi:hypothetical protein
MKTSFKVYIEKRKKSARTGKYPLYLRIIHNGKKAEGKINLVEIPEESIKDWHQGTRKFSGSKYQRFNNIIGKIESSFLKFCDNTEDLSKITPSDIRDSGMSSIVVTNIISP